MRPWAVLLVLLAGCRSRLIDPATGDEGGPSDAAQCASLHERIAVPLTRLEAIDAPPFAGAAWRVRIGFRWRPACDVLGDVAVVQLLDSGPDLAITAHLWRSSDVACAGAVETTAIVVLSDTLPLTGPQILNVGDRAAGGTLLLGVTVAAAPPGDGGCAAIPLGGRCTRDCQCSAALAPARCVPRMLGMKYPEGQCAVSCDEDAACAGISPGCLGAMAVVPFTCASSSCTDAACPFGQRCLSFEQASGCRPAMQAPTLPRSCRCSADCGPAAVCTLVSEDALACVLPCATDADCPGPHGHCGDLACELGRCLPNTC
jgi:hypothetical protein